EAGAPDVLLAEIRQRLQEFLSPPGIGARNPLRGGARPPYAEQPDPVEAHPGHAVQLRVRHVVEGGGPTESLAERGEPDPGVDLIERGIRRRRVHGATLPARGLARAALLSPLTRGQARVVIRPGQR